MMETNFMPTKTIVFSIFTSFLDLVEPALYREDIRFCRYDGSMSASQRDQALEDFKDPDGDRAVLLISLKAGNVVSYFREEV